MVAIQRGKGCDWFVWIEFDGKLANDDVCRFVKSSRRYSSGNAWVYTEHVVLILSSSWDNGFLGIWNICLNFPGLRSCHYIEWHVYTACSNNRDRPQVNEDKRSFKRGRSYKKHMDKHENEILSTFTISSGTSHFFPDLLWSNWICLSKYENGARWKKNTACLAHNRPLSFLFSILMALFIWMK